MPMNIYKSKTLVSLKLVNIGLENPKIVVSLPCLKIMHLEKIFYGTDDGPLIMEKLFSGCPFLEDLTVVKIFYKDIMPLLRVTSHTLKMFRLMFTKYFSVEIDCPRLKYMSFKDTQSHRIVVKNLSSLFKIDLDTDFNVKYGGSPSKPNDLRKRDDSWFFRRYFERTIHDHFSANSKGMYICIIYDAYLNVKRVSFLFSCRSYIVIQ